MANVRFTDQADDLITLNGGGAGNLAGFTLLWIGRHLTLTSSANPLVGMGHAPSDTHNVIYMINAAITYGSGPGDVGSGLSVPNTTDVFAIAIKKPSGSSSVTFYLRNLTTGAASSTSTPGTTLGDLGTGWDRTWIGGADGGSFLGTAHHGVSAAWYNSQVSNANLDTITNATQQIADLSPTKLWDINQASVATDVNNVLTGTDDQVSIVGTTVVSDSAFNFWTFGLSGGGGSPTPRNLAALGVG